MPMTLAQCIDEVQALMNDTAGLKFTDPLVTTWLKQGVYDITTKSLCYELKADPTALVDGQIEYAVPSGCRKIYNTYIHQGSDVSPKGLVKTDPKAAFHLTRMDSCEPEYWYEFANKAGLYPVFAADGARNTLGLHYSKVTDDVTLIPNLYQPLAILYATHKAKLMDHKPGQATQIYQHYMNSLMFHRQDLYERVPDALADFKLPDRTHAGGRG
jgi:hypothetical protein